MVYCFASCRWASKMVHHSLLVGVFLLLAGCTSKPLPSTERMQLSDHSYESWQKVVLPGKRKTLFAADQGEGAHAWRATADHSASLLRKVVRIEASALEKIRFSWKTHALIDGADMAVRDTEDAVLRVILSFEGDRNQFSAKNRMLSELSLALTGEEMPYATLMYVWCNKRPVGTVITNPRTDRIRKLVVESGRSHLGKWLEYERDIRADFIQAFGEEPGALTGIALMTDTDNTQTQATAWYGPIHFKPSLSKTSLAP
jgi:hypothetical protein